MNVEILSDQYTVMWVISIFSISLSSYLLTWIILREKKDICLLIGVFAGITALYMGYAMYIADIWNGTNSYQIIFWILGHIAIPFAYSLLIWFAICWDKRLGTDPADAGN